MKLLCDGVSSGQWWSQRICHMFVGQEQTYLQKRYLATYLGKETHT